MRSFSKDEHVVDAADEVSYHSLSVSDIDFGEDHYEVIEIGSLKWFFTNPDQLSVLAAVAAEAEASLRESQGQARCGCCEEWKSELLVEVRSLVTNTSGDLCSDCRAALTGRAA